MTPKPDRTSFAANAPNRDYRAAVELASFALWLWKEGWRPWTK